MIGESRQLIRPFTATDFLLWAKQKGIRLPLSVCRKVPEAVQRGNLREQELHSQRSNATQRTR